MKKHLLKYSYTKEQQKGILLLISLIIIINVIFLCWKYYNQNDSIVDKSTVWEQNQEWLDSLQNENKETKTKIFPFNPNFITDYKGAQLGLSIKELDKLYNYRKTNKYVNSPEEFQSVTGVSDSLLATIAPYFKFPDWVKNKNKFSNDKKFNFYQKNDVKIIKKNINFASIEDLIKISGIGEIIAKRIIVDKEKFGAFATMDQMHFIWGLSPEVIEKLKESYFTNNEVVKKWNVNELNLKDIATFPYFDYKIAKNIVSYRSMNGDFKNTEELKALKDFPVEKLEIIKYYIEF